MNSDIGRLRPYAFTQLRSRQDVLAAQGLRLLNFGVGDPEDETPTFIRQALAAAIEPFSRYPTATGLPELRRAVAAWLNRRYGIAIDPDRHVLPANGSKEAIFNLAPLLLDDPRRSAARELIAIPELAYQVYGDSTVLHHAEILPLPLDAHWLPDLNAITRVTGGRLKLLWLNFPNNPTGAVATLDYYREVLALAERYDFYVASDEAYSEQWFEAPPPSLLEAAEPSGYHRAIVINTLSKRSNMTAYRSGFIAGDPNVIAAMKNVRPRMGVATPECIQRAAVAAWNDEAHVTEQRARYAERRALFLRLFDAKGLRVDASVATFYLWLRVPDAVVSRDAGRFAEQLLEHRLLVLPGSFMGQRGAAHVRIALVPPLDVCREAVDILERVL